MNEIHDALTVENLARATGKHPSTVRILIDRGELPGYKTSMGYVIPWYWFDQWQRGLWTPTPKQRGGPKNDPPAIPAPADLRRHRPLKQSA
jgi:hypothetical protein